MLQSKQLAAMGYLVGLLVIALAGVTSAVLYAPRQSPVVYPPPQGSAIQESYFAFQLKSFRRSLKECAEYWEIPWYRVQKLIDNNFEHASKDLQCLIRCAGVNSGWWDDLDGLRYTVIESYFQPDVDDTCYADRTKECIDQRLSSCRTDCAKAYESFMCYLQQYGSLKSSEEYIPLTRLEAIQVAVDCINILQVSDDLLNQISQGEIPDIPEVHCLYRCQYLGEGVYDTQYRFNFSRLYIRHYDTPSPEFLGDEIYNCAQSTLEANSDECTGVFRARECFPVSDSPSRTVTILTTAAGVALDQKRCEPPIYREPYLPEIPFIQIDPVGPLVDPVPYK